MLIGRRGETIVHQLHAIRHRGQSDWVVIAGFSGLERLHKDYRLAQPTNSGFGQKNTEDYAFNVGEEYYMMIMVNTTGPDASPDDYLSVTAEFFAGKETDGRGHDLTDPPV